VNDKTFATWQLSEEHSLGRGGFGEHDRGHRAILRKRSHSEGVVLLPPVICTP